MEHQYMGDVSTPKPIASVNRVFWCEVCKKRRKHTVKFFDWCAPLEICRTCGLRVMGEE